VKNLVLVLAVVFVIDFVFAASDLETEKAESQKFIEKESKVPKTEQSLTGMLYRPTKVGKGDYPAATDTVTVEYKGTLRTGKVFDASPKGKPISFPLNGVIPCWTEALKKMQVGGSAVIVCPSNIAYGDKGVGADIKGGAALKFEVSLLKIAPF
jgi:FKBP-type peptidyl-prolyl cis-trans isomerase FkpA